MHVIETSRFNDNYRVHISNKLIGELPCKIVHTDSISDLALLYCPELDLDRLDIQPLPLSKQALLPGMSIFSFGYPISHTGETALFINGYVSGIKETFSGQTLAVLNCPLNHGNSGGPILSWTSNGLKVVGVARQKHIKEILDLSEQVVIEQIRESLKTRSIADVEENIAGPHAMGASSPRRAALDILVVKLYDALETHTQFNLSNAITGNTLFRFINECAKLYKGENKEELRRLNASLDENLDSSASLSGHPSSLLSGRSSDHSCSEGVKGKSVELT